MGEVGHPRNFKTPEDLERVWNDFKKHVEDVESLKWEKVQYVGKDGDRVTDNLKIPLTIEGFKRYCRENGYGLVQHYFDNQDNLYTKYIEICRAIKEEVRENHIIGGLLNVFNPSITQRLHGLTEKQETKHEGGISINIKEV